MKLSLQARARDGRLLMNVQFELPDDALVELIPVNDADTRDDAGSESVHAGRASRPSDSRAERARRPRKR